MSNGSSHRAVRPLVNGQQRNEKSRFFVQAAQWAMQALKSGRTQGKPPRIPVEIDYGTGRDFFHGRGIFKVMFDRMAANDSVDIRGWNAEDIESEFMDPVIDALLALDIHPETSRVFEEFRSELDKLGFSGFDCLEGCIENEMDPKDGSFGDDEFDFEPPDDEPSPAKPAREAVADMAVEKSARTKETPAKAVDTFAKHFDWVNSLPKVKPAARLILTEIIRSTCGCPFSWVGNTHLGKAAQLSERQVRRYLIRLEADGHITIRDYRKTWCRTARMIFVNRLAESAGVDPKSVEIPTDKTEFFKFRARFNGQNKVKKPKPLATVKSRLKADMSDYIDGSECPAPPDRNVIGRDKGFSVPIGTEKTHTPNVVSTSPPKGVLPPPGVEGKAKPTPSAKPVPKSEHAAVEAKKVSTARPPMDWPERNLPTVNRESALERMVRLGRVTHIHPRWLDGLACWVVRCRTIEGQKVYIEPKITHDGWVMNSCDALVVPLIDSDNRRISQAEFCRLLASGHIVAPDPNKPVIELEERA